MRTKKLTREPNRRILVLGAALNLRDVRSYEWDKLPDSLNVADFDSVIMDYTPFADSSLAKGMRVDRLPSWDQFGRLLFSKDSEIVVIGSPNFRLGTDGTLPSTWWLPVRIHFLFEGGVELRDIHAEFSGYFTHVRRWSFCFDRLAALDQQSINQFCKRICPDANIIGADCGALASTRYQKHVGFALRCQGIRVLQQSMMLGPEGQPSVIARSGLVLWLPEPTEISSTEGIIWLLRQRYGLEWETAPPAWGSAYPLPREVPILAQIEETQRDIHRLGAALRVAEDSLAKESRFRKLLYEQGVDGLEPIVRDSLRALGATVTEPTNRVRDDGRFTDPKGRNGILEIKGRTRPLKQDDIRELVQWFHEATTRENWKGKAVLVANLLCEKDPKERRSGIPPNCIEYARTSSICILTTTQLFRALVDQQNGRLSIDGFWDQIERAKGPCAVPEL